MSFLWYDLETFGRDPRRSRIAQFAAIRTDEDLKEIEAPISIFCKPAADLLPSPIAALITGITPQMAEREGVIESEFFARIAEHMGQQGTCAVGYNSLRFDDEFVRFGLYRNFRDAYEREWRNGNSRWDLLDVLRLAYALRPDALQWPKRDDGYASFKLEDLALANGVREGQAHEALSDVRALIGLARKLKDAHPRFWDYALSLRNKRHVLGLCDVVEHTPLLHISGRFPAERRHAALVAPLARNPKIDGRVIAFDLAMDPAEFENFDGAALAARLYVRQADLPEGARRLPLKEVHGNRCPAVVPLAHVRAAELSVLGLNLDEALARAAWLRAHPDFVERCVSLFSRDRNDGPTDPDGDLYGGFVGDGDKRLFPRIRSAAPHELAGFASSFTDPRLPELLFRYQARNWPESLDEAQLAHWRAYLQRRFAPGSGLGELDAESVFTELAEARVRGTDGTQSELLDAVERWIKDTLARSSER